MKIVPRDIVKEMRESYLDYAMSVIVTRALPDVRDGLKPVQRRILYAMHGLGLASNAKYRKSAMVVGEVLGKYHPHGDTSVYEAMVRLAQDFSMRYRLIDGQGNFGSIDGDSAAAMRYTEAKMTKISGEILKDIEKETVDFVPNYDGALKEPKVLPSAIPNLLINGALGIAVGMATKIPPHNLREVIGATVALIDNPKATTEDLLEFVKGPDFPTGGIIFNAKDIHHAYASGRGGIIVRGETDIVEVKSGSYQIIISSIPYQINKAELIIKMADLVKDKKIEGIRDIRDESDKDGLRIAIDLKAGTHPQKVVNNLYKRTELETAYHFNMLALVDGVPQVLSLKSMLENFILHRQVVVERRTKFDLKKAEERAHILQGLKKALDNIDAVIKTIKSSKDRDEARTALMKQFKLTEIQTNAILEMRLSTLAGLERKKIEDELDEKNKLIAELKALLADAKKILKVIKNELLDIAQNYGDERKTKVVSGQAKIIAHEDLIPEAECVLVVTHGGYIKRTDPSEYKRQKRGGTGVIDLDTKEEDFVTNLITANTHDDLLFFTNKGKAFQIKMYDIPEGKRASKGKSIMNFLALSADENITSVLTFPREMKKKKMSLVMVTKKGVIKKVDAESFHDVRRNGIISIKLTAGDELNWSYLVEKGDDIILASKDGQSVRFKESDAREMGRTAGGVRAIKLRPKDELIGADVIKKDDKDASLLVLSKNGFGKRTSADEYKVQKRGGSGIKTSKVTEKTGPLMKALVIRAEFEEAIAISKKGQIIRTALSDIPLLGRQTQGVRVMKLKTGDSIASLTCL
ncbi:MAG: DNA gyrase subunit A [Parcubacteria group bacterium]|nr:DNA gyrase subunit A [Parcubacteria group bacterium]MCR4343062.1 DNA gyrase subunit A [Patescibacteria group bacterium]